MKILSGEILHYSYRLKKKQDIIALKNINNQTKNNDIIKNIQKVENNNTNNQNNENNQEVKRIHKNKNIRISKSTDFGSLSVRTIPWSTVYVDGNLLGDTPIVKTKVGEGVHTLKLLPQGKEPAKVMKVTIRKDQETPLLLNF